MQSKITDPQLKIYIYIYICIYIYIYIYIFNANVKGKIMGRAIDQKGPGVQRQQTYKPVFTNDF